MVKREFQRILGLVVETCNIYTILSRVVHYILILNKFSSGKGERNILRLVVGTCNIYTVLMRNYSTTPGYGTIFYLYIGEERGAEAYNIPLSVTLGISVLAWLM